jgi:hypothetical protein
LTQLSKISVDGARPVRPNTQSLKAKPRLERQVPVAMSDYWLVDKKGLVTIFGIPYSHQHIARLEKAGKFPPSGCNSVLVGRLVLLGGRGLDRLPSSLTTTSDAPWKGAAPGVATGGFSISRHVVSCRGQPRHVASRRGPPVSGWRRPRRPQHDIALVASISAYSTSLRPNLICWSRRQDSKKAECGDHLAVDAARNSENTMEES